MHYVTITGVAAQVRFTFEVESSLKLLKLKKSWRDQNPWLRFMKSAPWVRARLNQHMLDEMERKNKRALSHMKVSRLHHYE